MEVTESFSALGCFSEARTRATTTPSRPAPVRSTASTSRPTAVSRRASSSGAGSSTYCESHFSEMRMAFLAGG